MTVDDILSTVVADGFWTIDDICTPDYRAACVAAGLLDGVTVATSPTRDGG